MVIKMINLYKRRNGLTLVEVIVAMAIIGIIAIGMLAMFSSAFKFIVHAGNTTESLFQAHKQIETILTQNSLAVSPTNIQLRFSSDGTDGTSFVSQGNVITVRHTINNSEVEITFFHPKY